MHQLGDKMKIRLVSVFGTIGLVAWTAGLAHAAVVDDTVYDTLSYTINEVDFNVTDIVYAQQAPDFTGYPPGLFPPGLEQTIAWRIPGDTLSAEGPDDAETLSILNAFAPFSNATGTFLLGLASDLPGDGDAGQEHLVLIANDAFAASAQGVAWSTLFPNTDEDDLISELETITTATDPAEELDFNDIFNFMREDAYNAGLFFAPGDTFTAVAFTDGLIIGDGVSSVSDPESPATPVPEPSTWAMLAAGFLGLAWVGLRRKRELPIVG